jgi:uncharacterized protein YbjQ (UPF0145 family)
MEHCSHCNEKLTVAFIGKSNDLLSDRNVRLINEYEGTDSRRRCNRCGDEPLKTATAAFEAEQKKLVADVSGHIESIRIATIHSPHKWDYNVLGMVSAQSTTGTGVFSEITSAFTDLLGTQSQTYNNKIKGGEDLCANILRQKALEMGAHAIIGADIDYAEVGGAKGMLMVCMTGTAVTLNNPEVLGADAVSSFDTLKTSHGRLKHLAAVSDVRNTL